MESKLKLSKKASKKLATKAEKLRLREEAATATTSLASTADGDGDEDLSSQNYGDFPLFEIRSKEEVQFPYTCIEVLGQEKKDGVVLVRWNVQTVRAVGKKIAFVVLRYEWCKKF